MKNLQIIFFVWSAILLYSCGPQKQEDKTDSQNTPMKEAKYSPDWKSLAGHNEAPDWFQDAKFGIYFHWGVYSVPEFGSEWYPHWMHMSDDSTHWSDKTSNIDVMKSIYNHHLKTYGHPSKFGYHDFVPMFKAQKFNPEEWAELFQKAGAKFAGPVAEHHDGFSMWDSDVTPWNAKKKGPKRDITGELKKSITSKGMKFITTFHHARNLQRGTKDSVEYWDSHYPLLEGMPPSSKDPELALLYGNIEKEKWHKEVWFAKLKEVVDKYQPDIIWFDSWLDRIPEQYRKEFAAYYLNEADKWGKEVVIVRKQDDLPLDFSVDDIEKARKNDVGAKVWMTDETISKGSWSYTKDLKTKDTKDLVHVLVDIVSKNGVLLLNISPRADGSISQEQQKVLLEIGQWLKVNGESIYGTRPWVTYGEGPTKEPEGHHKNAHMFLNIKYSSKDIRFTSKGNSVYATLLGWPEKSEVLITSFAKKGFQGKVSNVSLLGSDQKIMWKLEDNGLKVTFPDKVTDKIAPVLKITLVQ